MKQRKTGGKRKRGRKIFCFLSFFFVLFFVVSIITNYSAVTIIYGKKKKVSLGTRLVYTTVYPTCKLPHTLACRHGVFLPKELSNLPSLLHRLGKVHSLFTHPHPLTKVTDSCEDGEDGEGGGESVSGAVVSMESFHSGFLKYLVDNRFCSLMYHYLDYYKLVVTELSVTLHTYHSMTILYSCY